MTTFSDFKNVNILILNMAKVKKKKKKHQWAILLADIC